MGNSLPKTVGIAMLPHKYDRFIREHFAQRYDVIRQAWLVRDEPQLLPDHVTEADCRCRFCRRGTPDVSFRKVAHAVSEMLGNRSTNPTIVLRSTPDPDREDF